MKNSNNNKDVSLGLIVFLMFVFPPAAIILIVVKYIFPFISSLLSGPGDIFARKNRYSGYEKKGEEIFKDIWNSEITEDSKRSESKKHNSSENSSVKAETKRKKEKKTKIPYATASIVLLIIAGLLVFSGAVSGITEFMEHGSRVMSSEDFIASVIFLLTGGVLGGVGLSLRHKVRMIKKYLSVIGKRGYVKIDEISKAFSKPYSKVKRELQSVIESGVFDEYAYIDLGSNVFLRDSSYKPKETEKTADQQTTEKKGTELGEYGDIIAKIRYLNDIIADETVSARIDSIEQCTRRIFEYLKKNPAREKDVHVFMTYYLPTTLKLLESYSEIERVGVAGDNMKSAKDNIEKTLDLLVAAYKKLLDNLYESDSMDISSDIDVLEQMMKKDGLTGSGFGMK